MEKILIDYEKILISHCRLFFIVGCLLIFRLYLFRDIRQDVVVGLRTMVILI